MQQEIRLSQTHSKEDFELHLQIRRLVFQEEQGIDPTLDVDKNDKSKKTKHYILRVDGQAVGAVRWREGSIGYKIERFCILPDFRSKGLGKKMLELLLGEIPNNQKVYLGSQDAARAFYEKSGFKVTGSPYWEAGILHHRMVMGKSERKSDAKKQIKLPLA